jgi:hypothetical protein
LDVEWLILADAAQVVGNKLFLMGGGWDRIVLHNFPSQHALSIALAIKVPWNETNEKHAFEIEMVSEDGETIKKLGGTFEAGRPLGITPGQEQRIQTAVNAIMVFGNPGIIAVVARIDGEERRRVTFNVVSGTPVPGQTQS